MGDTKWLDRIFEAETMKEIEQVYDDWSESYETDVFKYGYIATGIVTGFVGRYIPPGNTLICEAGVGTGLLGESLKILGYTNIDGFDISEGMLRVAEKKKAYRELRKMALGEELDYSSGKYDAVVSMGTFTVGHAPASGFDELIRITKPGGFLILSIRTDREDLTGFIARLESLEKDGKWQTEDRSEIFRSVPLGKPEVENRAFIFKKTLIITDFGRPVLALKLST